jgi:hypothetical protein
MSVNFKKGVNTLDFYWAFVKLLKSFCYRTALNKEQYISICYVL